jgi:sialate O-acetylesterase
VHRIDCLIPVLVGASLLAAAAPCLADVKLPAIFGDHMVLQRDMKVPVWGWAAPGEKVTVSISGQKQTATAGQDGQWTVTLGALNAGGPLEMTVEGKTKITLKDILVGEVWVGSGQSNMEMGVIGCLEAPKEIAAANCPEVRLFAVETALSVKPLDDCKGRWVVCSPGTVGNFSAVLYFFGRDLYKDLKVPMGLIHASRGGTPVESWMSLEALRADPGFKSLVDRYRAGPNIPPEAYAKFQEELAKWDKEAMAQDPGNKGFDQGWADPKCDLKDWKDMPVPGAWESTLDLNIDGAVWIRREIAIPGAWAGKDLTLSLGPIDDFDTTYFNNEKVGATGKGMPGGPRTYIVPGKLVKAGPATLAIRVWDQWRAGGLVGVPAQIWVNAVGGRGSEAIKLAGTWKYKIELAIPGDRPLPPRPSAPMGPDNPWLPTNLYNAMIHPIVPFAIRGATWYQGESNTERAYQYRTLFPAMITDWRKAWGEGDFPFAFVQLPNYMPHGDRPVDSDWAELREAQAMALKLPNTGQAVTIDLGEAANVHPRNKQDVGRRLALWAEAEVYGKRDVAYSGPMYKSMKVDADKIALTFDHVGGGLVVGKKEGLAPTQVVAGGELKGFAIAGDDRKFVWATAKIVLSAGSGQAGDTVLVSSRGIAKPVAARYAWANNPEGNLYSKEGLPASPFRTDEWKGVTADKP